MRKKYKKALAALLVGCMGAGMLPADVSAAGGQSVGSGEYSLIVDNDCAGAVRYGVTIGAMTPMNLQVLQPEQSIRSYGKKVQRRNSTIRSRRTGQ